MEGGTFRLSGLFIVGRSLLEGFRFSGSNRSTNLGTAAVLKIFLSTALPTPATVLARALLLS